jgi:hypothetical protein
VVEQAHSAHERLRRQKRAVLGEFGRVEIQASRKSRSPRVKCMAFYRILPERALSDQTLWTIDAPVPPLFAAADKPRYI